MVKGLCTESPMERGGRFTQGGDETCPRVLDVEVQGLAQKG